MLSKRLPTQPLSGNTIQNYYQLLVNNQFDISRKYLPRVIYTSLMALFTGTPLGLIEKCWKQKAIKENKIEQNPIFIIGHWRSGTTFLHYLMSKDPNWGYLTNAQAFCPNQMWIVGQNTWLKQIAGLHLPHKRPMDDVKISVDLPQEEEFALGNLSNQSCYHWWTFPKRMKEYFEKYVLLKDLDSKEYTQFQQTYLELMKKVSLINNNKRLLIKNPVNTGRIPFLLELFPNAQFVYLHRNPIDVYCSTVKLHTRLLKCFSFQDFDKNEIEKNTLQFHKQLIEKYEKDKLLIPKENLIELKYQRLIQEPMKTITQIYNTLQIPDLENAVIHFENFLETQKTYKRDTYSMNRATEKRLKDHFEAYTPLIC